METNQPIRILFVEDVPADAELAARVIRKEGLAFTSTRVDTPDAFIAALDEFRPDVIVSDYAMPQFDGMRALKISLERNPALPVIMLTGTLNEETAVKCIKAGATDYVIKERITRLPFAVKEALAQHKTLQQKEAAEQALRASEAQYRLLAENMSDTVWLMDMNLRTIYISPSVIRTRGFTLDEINALPLDRQLTPDSLTRAMELFAEALSPENLERPDPRTIYSVELEFYRKDGTKFWSENTFTLILDQNKQPINILGTGRDITERKRAEDALYQRQQEFEALAENAPDSVVRFDISLRHLYVNRAMERLSGLTKSAYLGKTNEELGMPPDLVSFWNKELNEVIQTAAFKIIPFEFIGADGILRYFEARVVPEFSDDGKVVSLLSVVRDITERKRAEEALREAEERFRVIFEHANDAIHITNADGEILTVNSRMCELMGYRREELLKMRVADLQAPEVRQSGIVVKEELARHGNVLFEGLNLHRSGRRIPVEISVACIARLQGDWYVSIVRDITERKRAEETMRQRLEHLQALRAVDQAIAASLDLRVTLDILLDQTLSQLGIDAAAVHLLDPYQHTLKFSAGRGFRTRAIEATNLRLGEDFAGRVALERRLVQVFDAEMVNPESPFAKLWSAEDFKAYWGIPLIAKGQVKGVLEIFHRTDFTPLGEWIEFLETLGGQAAITIDSAQLFEGLQRANMELGVAYDATIEGWSRALDLRDKETEGHTQRVTEITLALARAMGMDERTRIHVRRGALLHDIGKMGVPDSILLKPDQLTDEEWIIMRKHPQFAREMLLPITYLRQSLDIPYCHHEKWDGTGYPQGLQGERIPLAARIFAIVDVWDALTSNRPYRKAWTKPQARTYIHEQSGKHFDPQVVEVFIQKLESDSS